MPARQAQVFVKKEASPGTEIATAGTDAVFFKSFEMQSMPEGPFQKGGLSASQVVPVPGELPGRWCEIKARTEVKSQGGGALEIGPLLQSAGFSESIVALVATYTQQADPMAAANAQSVTIDEEETVDGELGTTFGARFNGVFSFDNKGEVNWDWTGVGAHKDPTALAALTSATYKTGSPYQRQAETDPVVVHSYGAFIVKTGSLDLRNEVVRRESTGAGEANGYHAWPPALVRNEPPMGEMEVECVDVAIFDWLTKWKNVGGVELGDIEWVFQTGARTHSILMPNCVLGKRRKQVATKPMICRFNFTVHGLIVITDTGD